MINDRLFASSALTNIAAGLFAVAVTLATVSAVRAEEPGIDSFRAGVEKDIDRKLRLPPGQSEGRHGIATIAVAIDADGKVQTADLVRSSGFDVFDREALRTAHAISYPATGKPRTVAMVLGFNRPVNDQARNEGRRLVTAWRAGQRVMLAEDNAARQPDS